MDEGGVTESALGSVALVVFEVEAAIVVVVGLACELAVP